MASPYNANAQVIYGGKGAAYDFIAVVTPASPASPGAPLSIAPSLNTGIVLPGYAYLGATQGPGGAKVSITPRKSGLVHVEFDGYLRITPGVTTCLPMSFGMQMIGGPGPNNAPQPTTGLFGAQITGASQFNEGGDRAWYMDMPGTPTAPGGQVGQSFHFEGTFNGLAIGTSYWFDVELVCLGTTNPATFSNPTISFVIDHIAYTELPLTGFF